MSWRARKPSIRVVTIAALLLFLVDWASMQAGSSTFPGGPLDESAHVLTAVFALWAVGRSLPKQFWIGAILGSVLLDADHIPGRLGAQWLTAGTPRPYTHSFITMAFVLLIAMLRRRWRPALLGVLCGLALHFWRDLSEPRTGVSLLWPFSDDSFRTSHASYLIAMGVIAVMAVVRTPEIGNLYQLAVRRRLRTSDLT